MKLPWFKRNGIIFSPSSIIGWIILLTGIAYSVYSFIEIDGRSHSISDTLINFIFKLLIIIAIYSMIAYLTSRDPLKNDKQ
jgi:ABC-type maltose transport system permease subunit